MPKTLLLVEDDLKLQALIERAFTQSGFLVVTARGEKEAKAALDAHPIAAVICDIMLVEGDGWSVLRYVKNHTKIPVLMLTARSEESDTLFGFELGADDYVTKPFSLKELIARIHVLLGRHPKQHTLLTHGALVCDRVAQRCHLNQAPLALTALEYDLLVYFMEHPGRVLTREDLIAAVWGYTYLGDSRTVDTHVRRLRQKLLPLKCIHTVIGRGYRFEVSDDAL